MNISGVRSKLAKLLNSALCILHSAFVELRSTLVGLDGLEPSTSRLSGARSNHLSYKPLLCVDSSHLSARVFSFSSRSFISISYEFRVMSYELLSSVAWKLGGDDGIRTHDPLLAGQVLSQLSYTPIPRALFFSRIIPVPENWTTKDLYAAFCVPISSWLVWQNRDILSRSP